jgi:hypothetical protein
VLISRTRARWCWCGDVPAAPVRFENNPSDRGS